MGPSVGISTGMLQGGVAELRRILLEKAEEVGIARSRLAATLRSLDVLELKLAFLDRANELGVAEARLEPVLRSIDAICESEEHDPIVGAPGGQCQPVTDREAKALPVSEIDRFVPRATDRRDLAPPR